MRRCVLPAATAWAFVRGLSSVMPQHRTEEEQKKGPPVAERPKSREETPKEGCEASQGDTALPRPALAGRTKLVRYDV